MRDLAGRIAIWLALRLMNASCFLKDWGTAHGGPIVNSYPTSSRLKRKQWERVERAES